jgi:hypothetical protein
MHDGLLVYATATKIEYATSDEWWIECVKGAKRAYQTSSTTVMKIALSFEDCPRPRPRPKNGLYTLGGALSSNSNSFVESPLGRGVRDRPGRSMPNRLRDVTTGASGIGSMTGTSGTLGLAGTPCRTEYRAEDTEM